VYDADSNEPRFHIFIATTLENECKKRRGDTEKYRDYEPPISDWLSEAYEVVLNLLKELHFKYKLSLPVPTLEQVKQAVGECIMAKYSKDKYYVDNYNTCKAWAVRAGKLLDPNSKYEAKYFTR
jgi:hypothetical protein